jgi:hypothetical protein
MLLLRTILNDVTANKLLTVKQKAKSEMNKTGFDGALSS